MNRTDKVISVILPILLSSDLRKQDVLELLGRLLRGIIERVARLGERVHRTLTGPI